MGKFERALLFVETVVKIVVNPTIFVIVCATGTAIFYVSSRSENCENIVNMLFAGLFGIATGGSFGYLQGRRASDFQSQPNGGKNEHTQKA